MSITAETVRELLTSRAHEPTLVLHNGTTSVVPAADLQEGSHPGAVVVTSRGDLRGIAGDIDVDHPSEQDLRALAQRLDTAVSKLGG